MYDKLGNNWLYNEARYQLSNSSHLIWQSGNLILEHCLFLTQNPKVAGYSVGEIAALCVAESITAEEGLSITFTVS